MTASPAWTGDRVQTLTRLWRDGLSASQIARALAGGVTRNAVIGKIHRLGLSGRAKPSPPSARPRGTPARTRSRRAAPVLSRLHQAAAPCGPAPENGTTTVLDIRRGQCRWPIGDPLSHDFRLCGAQALRGAYCGGHAEMAYRPRSRKPPRDHLLKLAGLA